MEACLCAYVSREELTEENERIKPIVETGVEKNEEKEAEISQQEKCEEETLNLEQKIAPKDEDNLSKQQNDHNIGYTTSSTSTNSTSASNVLVVEARNWQLRQELSEAEDAIRCLEQSLREQWSKRNKFCYEIQQIKAEKTKLIKDMQSRFSAHVNERNKLVNELTETRQSNLLTLQQIRAAEIKSRALKIERNESAECLYKATVELYNSHTLNRSANHSSLSEVYSETESQTTMSTSVNGALSSNKSIVATNTLACSKGGNSSSNSSSSTEYAPETNVEISDNESASFKLKINNSKSKIFEPKKPSNEIRLDLSFVDKERLQNVDSGFSEATNLATQSSITTIRIIDASTPSILE